MQKLEYIERLVGAHPILNCDFLESMKAGVFNTEQIKTWITQQFYFSRQFPRCLAALYARIEDTEVSEELISKFLLLEYWGSNNTSAHRQLFIKTLVFFGLSIEDLKLVEPLPETKQFLDYRLNICLTGKPEEALGCMAFAHEFVNTKIFTAYFKGVSSLPGITSHTLDYFVAHMKDEAHDYKIMKTIIQKLYKEALDGDSVELEILQFGALNTLLEREKFFNKIHERLINQ